jgi:hypothetical protein
MRSMVHEAVLFLHTSFTLHLPTSSPHSHNYPVKNGMTLASYHITISSGFVPESSFMVRQTTDHEKSKLDLV